jgi:hypothetical protein
MAFKPHKILDEIHNGEFYTKSKKMLSLSSNGLEHQKIYTWDHLTSISSIDLNLKKFRVIKHSGKVLGKAKHITWDKPKFFLLF